MKKLIILGMVALVTGCSKPSGYKVEVALNGAEGKVMLEKRESGKFVPVDSADVVNGVAVFEGKVDFPEQYYLNIAGKNQRAVMFLENAKIRIDGHADTLRSIKITGSPVNDEYQALKNELNALGEKGSAKYKEYEAAVQSGDTVKAPEIMKEVEAIFGEQDSVVYRYVRNNPASWLTPMFLSQIQYSMEVDELEARVNALDPKLSVVPAVIDLKKHIEKMKNVAIGQTAPDFTLNDPSGNPVKLSDVYARNEYTLIDFWASWCGPCRQENPNVVAVFNEFKGKGFGIIGVSLDRDQEKWVKAIADDKLDWVQVSDLKYWQSEAASLYGVNSIPSNFLVDKTGKIIAHNLREKALKEKVAELLP